MNVLKNAAESITLDEMLSLPDDEKAGLGLEHTPREISQQPQTWIGTFEILKSKRSEIGQFLAESGVAGPGDGQLSVVLIGAGTSDYVGRAVEALLRAEWRCSVRAVPSTDLMTEMDDLVAAAPVGTRHLWISFSRSGDSFEGVKVLGYALGKHPQIRHLIVTCNASGKMAAKIAPGRENVFCIELDDKVNDRGLAMTSSFTNMVVAGQCLAHITDLDRYEPIVRTLSDAAANFLSHAASMGQAMAHRDHIRICFLGSGPLKAAGDESALKVLEFTAGNYSTMSESFLGLRHGPLSWLDQDSLVVGFLSNSPEKRRVEIGLLDELNPRDIVADIVAVSPQASITVGSAGSILPLGLPEWFDDNYRPPIDVLFAQCLGLFASVRRELKPDDPSADGRIRRVVSDIKFSV